jgi:heat shock protein HslJ
MKLSQKSLYASMAFLVVASLLAGCGALTSLAGTSWKLATLNGQPALTNVSVTMSFGARGTVAGSDGCNLYSGTYTVNGSKLTIKLGPSTMMACPDAAVTKQATAFTTALGNTASFSVSGDKLTLKDVSGKELATFNTLEPAALTGTNWQATGINNGKGGVVSTATTSKSTALFATDGKLSGNTGCNSYNTTYTTDGNKISIKSPMATTRMACEQALMDQETQYLAALAKAATYTLTESKLELRDSSGALQVSYLTAK